MNRSLFYYPILMTLCGFAAFALLRIGRPLQVSGMGGSPVAISHVGLSRVAAAIQTQGHSVPLGPVLAYWRDNVRPPFSLLLLQIFIVILAARFFGIAARWLHQPTVAGEIVAGILLGPSVFGWIWPQGFAAVFPKSSLPTLGMLSQIGIILFMFIVGLEIDLKRVREKAHAALLVSHLSIVVPFLLGLALSLGLYKRYAPVGIPFQAFALFMGIAMSITAFPVLARILEEHRLTQTLVGSTALTCAAVDDVTAWTLLGFVVSVVTSGGAFSVLAVTLILTTLFVLVMLRGVRPFLRRSWANTSTELSHERLAVILGLVLVSAWITEAIGIHALFGAFLAGTVMPESVLRVQLRERLEGFAAVFMLPLFFAFTGLRTDIGLLSSPTAWITCAGIILIATLGKLGGSLIAARWTGLNWHDSFILGALMNTRGLMELIVLNIGFDLGVLSRDVFAMLVLMALLTTLMTGPVVSRLTSREERPESKSLETF